MSRADAEKKRNLLWVRPGLMLRKHMRVQLHDVISCLVLKTQFTLGGEKTRFKSDCDLSVTFVKNYPIIEKK